MYRWEFEKGRKALAVSPQGPASFDDPDLVIQAVLAGIGIGNIDGEQSCDAAQQRSTNAGFAGLVPFVSRVFPQLSKSAKPTSRLGRFDQYSSLQGLA